MATVHHCDVLVQAFYTENSVHLWSRTPGTCWARRVTSFSQIWTKIAFLCRENLGETCRGAQNIFGWVTVTVTVKGNSEFAWTSEQFLSEGFIACHGPPSGTVTKTCISAVPLGCKRRLELVVHFPSGCDARLKS